MDTATFDEKDVICWQSDNSVRYVEVDRVTTVWPHIAQNCELAKKFIFISILAKFSVVENVFFLG